MKKTLTNGPLFFFIALLLLQSCKTTSSSQRSTGEVGYSATDVQAAIQKDSLLVAKYSRELDTSPGVIRESLPLYGFIDSVLNTPYGENPGETTMNDITLVRKLYEEVYNRKIPNSYDDLMKSKLVPKFSDKSYLAEGDFLFFSEDREYRDIEVVGIYLHNNKFVTCSQFTGAVTINDMESAYWNSRYKMAGRLR